MFNFLKNIFNKNKDHVIIHVVYITQEDKNNTVRKKRKYVKSGKYVGLSKKYKKKGRK